MHGTPSTTPRVALTAGLLLTATPTALGFLPAAVPSTPMRVRPAGWRAWPQPHGTNTNTAQHTALAATTAEPALDVSTLASLDQATSGSDAIDRLNGLKDDGSINLWNSTRLVGNRMMTEVEVRLLTQIEGDIGDKLGLYASKDIDRSYYALFVVVLGSAVAAISFGQIIPGGGAIKFALEWLLTFTPFIFLAVGLQFPEVVQPVLVRVERALFPEAERRMLRHEAGHFLVGYLCGLPIAEYCATDSVANAVRFWPLADDTAQEKVLEVFDGAPSPSPPEPAVRGSTSTQNNLTPDFGLLGPGRNKPSSTLDPEDMLMDPRTKWPFRGIDHDTLDRLAVVSLAGVMAELLEYGDGDGGFADLSQLQVMLNAASPPLDDEEQMARVRWATAMSATILKRHSGALEDLVAVMGEGKSVGQCAAALEACTDVKGEAVEARQREKTGLGKRSLPGPSPLKQAVAVFSPEQAEKWFPADDWVYRDPNAPLIREEDVVSLAALTTVLFMTLVLSGALKI